MAFWSKFFPVDFNLDLTACVTFCLAMTSDARFRPVFKASQPKVLAPLFNKGTADLNRLPKACSNIPFQLGVGNNRDMLSPGNYGVASF